MACRCSVSSDQQVQDRETQPPAEIVGSEDVTFSAAQVTKLQERAQSLGVALGAVAALMYVAGICSCALYYEARGISALSLTRVSYILTGFWFLAPIAFVIYLRLIWRVPATKTAPSGKAVAVISVVFFPVSLMAALTFAGYQASLSEGIADETTPGAIATLMELAAVALLASGAIDVARQNSAPGGRILFAGVIVVFLGSVYFGVFQTAFMPNFSSELGGGAPQGIRFVLKGADSEADPSLSQSACPSSLWGLRAGVAISIPYALTLETDQSYYVALPDVSAPAQPSRIRTMAVPRSSVSGIIYGASAPVVGPDGEFAQPLECDAPRPSQTPAPPPTGLSPQAPRNERH